MLNYQDLYNLIDNRNISFIEKWPEISKILNHLKITFLDLLKLLPSRMSAYICVDFTQNFETISQISQHLFKKIDGRFVSYFEFTESDPNMPYKKIGMGSDKLQFHAFIVNEILPNGLYTLLSDQSFNFKLEEIFNNFLDFNKFSPTFSKISEPNDHWASNVISLIKQMDIFFIKTFHKSQEGLYYEAKSFLKEFQEKVNQGIFPFEISSYLQIKLQICLHEILRKIEDGPQIFIEALKSKLSSKLKEKTFWWKSGFSLKEVFEKFEQKSNYSHSRVLNILCSLVQDQNFLIPAINLGEKAFDEIFWPEKSHEISKIQQIDI